MPNLRIFVEDIVALVGAMTDKCLWSELENIACDFSVKRVDKFGLVLYRNQ